MSAVQREISAAGLGLLSTPCPDCGAGAADWCRRRRAHVDAQHDGRYDAWRADGLPVARDTEQAAAS